MPKLESTRYTVLFATAVSVVCALLVSAAAVGLRDRQQSNAQLYKQKNVLLAAGLAQPGEVLSRSEVLALFDNTLLAGIPAAPPYYGAAAVYNLGSP